MKFFTIPLTAFVVFLAASMQAQTNGTKSSGLSPAKTQFIQSRNYLAESTSGIHNTATLDSLKGFNEAAVRADFLKRGFSGDEYFSYLKVQQRKYIKKKYGFINPQIEISAPSRTKQLGAGAAVNGTPCINEGFEQTTSGAYTNLNSVTGWTVSSRYNDGVCPGSNWSAGSNEFSVVATPVMDGVIGYIPHSPLGGTKVVKLNDSVAGTTNMTRIAQMFPVTSANTLFQYAFAGSWESGGHFCCDEPGLNIFLRDCSGNLLNCSSVTLTPYALGGCSEGPTNYTIVSSGAWTNWQVRSIDLTPYIGSCVNIEVVASDCSAGGHRGYAYFDAVCGTQFVPTSTVSASLGGYVNMCSGSSYATLQAPLGYSSYAWSAPGSSLSPAQATLSSLTVTNAVAGSVYTVQMLSASNCIFTATYVLSPSNVGIASVLGIPTCSLGTSGTAIVLASGSGSGYNYSWTNSTGSVVSTSSVASNLSIGNYTISVTAIGSPSCGNASSVVSINVAPVQARVVSKQFCGIETILAAPTGTNYQWYNNLTAISPTLGGTGSSYTLTSITTNTLYWLSYTTNQGCKDSVLFRLTPIPSGNMSISSLVTPCTSTSTGGMAVITLSAAASATASQNWYQLTSTGSTLSYSFNSGTTAATVYTINNLTAGSYSALVSDGVCKYATSFTLNPYAGFNMTVSNSQTICNGNNTILSASVTAGSSAGYTYSWSPATFISGSSLQPQIIMSPTAVAGNVNTIIYTVVVKPTNINCPQQQTVALTVANLLPPLIMPFTPLCSNSNTLMGTGSPTGGVYSNNSAITPSGLITPSLANLGVNNFTYAINVGPCVAASPGSFTISSPPTLGILGNTLICEQQSTALLASGANTYTWNNGSTAPVHSVSPTATSAYTLSGTNVATTCSNTAIVTVSVMPVPQLTILGDTLICAGKSGTLNVSGAASYVWNTGAATSTVVITPTATTVYSVQGTNASSACVGGKLVTVLVTDCSDTSVVTGIKKLNNESRLIIYPNPSNGKFKLDTKNELDVIVIDCLGKIIIEEKIKKGSTTLDLSGYADGIYVLKATRNGEIFVTKLVKKE